MQHLYVVLVKVFIIVYIVYSIIVSNMEKCYLAKLHVGKYRIHPWHVISKVWLISSTAQLVVESVI